MMNSRPRSSDDFSTSRIHSNLGRGSLEISRTRRRMKAWPVFHFLFQSCCVLGFLVQVGLFVDVYLRYPVRTETSSVIVNQVAIPALTICKKFSGLRTTSRIGYLRLPVDPASVCENFRWPTIQNNPMCLFLDLPAKRLFEEALDVRLFITECISKDSCQTTPMPFFASPFGICYLYNSNFSKQYIKAHYSTSKVVYVYDWKALRGYDTEFGNLFVLALHSPLQLVNMQNMSPLTITSGKSYSVLIKKTIWNLLPPPYNTKCRNYEPEFSMNNRSAGYASQAICWYRCFVEVSLNSSRQCVNPFYPPTGWPFTEEDLQFICQNASYVKSGNIFVRKYTTCRARCPKDCRMEIFEMEFERNPAGNTGKTRTDGYQVFLL